MGWSSIVSAYMLGPKHWSRAFTPAKLSMLPIKKFSFQLSREDLGLNQLWLSMKLPLSSYVETLSTLRTNGLPFFVLGSSYLIAWFLTTKKSSLWLAIKHHLYHACLLRHGLVDWLMQQSQFLEQIYCWS